MLRAVLDTNIFVSSLLNKKGAPARPLDAWRAGEYLLITSPPIMKEIKTVLEFPRIRVKYGLKDQDIQDLLDLLEKDAITVPGLPHVDKAIPEDQTDVIFLSCALEAGADFIVSGDHHLLDLKAFTGIPIIPVIEFFDRLAKHKVPVL